MSGDLDKELAGRLKQAIRYGGGNNAVFERTGISLRNIGHYLQGRFPKAPVCVKLADACRVNLAWLVAGLGPMSVDEVALPSSSLLSGTDLVERLHKAVAFGGGSNAVCDRGDADPVTLDLYLGGEPLHPNTLVRLARGCGVNLEWLLAGSGPMAPAPSLVAREGTDTAEVNRQQLAALIKALCFRGKNLLISSAAEFMAEGKSPSDLLNDLIAAQTPSADDGEEA